MNFCAEDYEYVKRIAKCLDLPDNFGPEGYDSVFCPEDIEYILNEAFPEEKFDCSYGVSKCVIIPYDADFVVKIPFNGCWYPDWDIAEEDCDDEPPQSFMYFNSAEGDKPDDYCWSEIQKYEAAAEAGYEELLPVMELVTYIGIHPIYIQERVVPFSPFHFKRNPPSKDGMKYALEHKNDLGRRLNDTWRAACYDFYGEGFLENFLAWSDTVEIDFTSDLHTGNYGVRIDGSPVIFDYAGFWEDY